MEKVCWWMLLSQGFWGGQGAPVLPWCIWLRIFSVQCGLWGLLAECPVSISACCLSGWRQDLWILPAWLGVTVGSKELNKDPRQNTPQPPPSTHGPNSLLFPPLRRLEQSEGKGYVEREVVLPGPCHLCSGTHRPDPLCL